MSADPSDRFRQYRPRPLEILDTTLREGQQTFANPVGALLSAAMMLDGFGEAQAAQRLRDAVHATLAAGLCTPDLGGVATTRQFTSAVCQRLAG